MSGHDTFVDGCGVFDDGPIGKGTRIRFKLNEDRQQDVSVFVEEGVLHILGQYRPLLVLPVEANHVEITTERWNTS